MQNNVGGGNDSQQHSAGLSAVSDPKVLVATTVAALVLAGSAYVWRRGSGVMGLTHAAPIKSSSAGDGGSKHKGSSDSANSRLRRNVTMAKASNPDLRASVSGIPSDDGEGADDADEFEGAGGSGRYHDTQAGSMGKSSRAKERRRRGKDPLKELLKPGGGKLAKVLKATDASTSSFPSTPTHSRNSSEIHRRGSTSRQPEKSPSEDSAQAASSSSSTVVPQASSFSDSLDDNGLLSPSFASSHSQPPRSRSKSRSRSRLRDMPNHEPSTSSMSSSKNNGRSNSDAASTISSVSSSTNTEATTPSSTSTCPSSLTSPTIDGHSDVTPKAEFGRASLFSGPSLPTPTSPITSSRKSQMLPQPPDSGDPWGWDGAGNANSSQATSKPQRTKASSILDSSETEGTPIPYALVVSAKSPAKEVSRRTFGADAKEEQESSSERDDHEEEEEVPPIVFPSLNNPAPDSSSPSRSFSTEPNSTSSSLSRPQSRASSSSSSNAQFSLKSKSPGPGRNNALNLAPFTLGTPPLGSGAGMIRRAPTPRELGGSGKRPATPGTTSNTSSPLLSGSVLMPSSPSSQSFPGGFQGSSAFALSAQTQVASLRGALEASRLREQKQKDEVDRVTKERDNLQWENVAWRRREGELQAQLQQMMLQMQSYASYLSNNVQQPHPPQVLFPSPPTMSNPTPAADAKLSENIVGANSEEIDGSGVEGSTIVTSVPEGYSDPSPAKGDGPVSVSEVELDPTPKGDDEGGGEESEEAKAGEQEQEQAPLAATGPQHRPQPFHIVPPPPKYGIPYVGGGGILSPSILHSPMGGYHYPLHATQPVGFGPHGHPLSMPSPTPFPFHMPPQLQNQQRPFSPTIPNGSAPQSPGGMMHPGMVYMNPFVVNPAASPSGAFHNRRPSTPGGTMNGQQMHGSNVPPHPHPPNGGYVGVGMGTAGKVGSVPASPFAAVAVMASNASGSGGGSAGSASPDLTGSPSLMNAFLMQERGRRRGSAGSATMSLLGGSKARGSVLPSDHGIGRRNGGGKSSSGSGSDGGVDEGEDDGVFNEMLADAILKRPGSIRMGSSRKGSFRGASSSEAPTSVNGLWNDYNASPSPPEKVEGEEEEQREFTFPSLSDMGSVVMERRANGPGALHSSSPPLSVSPSVALATLQEEEPTVVAKSESEPVLSRSVQNSPPTTVSVSVSEQ